MTPEAFALSLEAAGPPPGTGSALQALWWAGKGDWDQAHECAQQQTGDPDSDLVHAWLHRQEGDAANASYWYGRAGQTLPSMPLQEEWHLIAERLLSASP